MSNETQLLRQLAQAIDDLEAMVSFMPDKPDFKVQVPELEVSWSTGCATRGYAELRAGMRRVIGARWLELRDEAIAAKAMEIDRLRQELARPKRLAGDVA
ncbi:MAG TPA: hypothetical protein P5305_01495 [Rubrivivax sp.]|nr:hypothetical protein [Rubrivivax sp.]HRY86527.1 hypothetical protein [Rubrivivax sp.]